MKLDKSIKKTKTFVPCSITTRRFRVGQAALLLFLVVMGTSAFALEKEQAKRMHDRLAGTPPTENVLCFMEQLIIAGQPREAAHLVMSINVAADVAAGRLNQARLDAAQTACGAPLDNSASRKAFYSTSLRDFVMPWTNRAQTKHGDYNDYAALVTGMIRDDEPFDTVLSTKLYYHGVAAGLPGLAVDNNDHFRALGEGDHDLSDPAVMTTTTRPLAGGTNAQDVAGIMTTRAAGVAFFSKGTNRRMFRFTAMNFLCRDLEQMKDASRSHDRVRQDASRSPGGDSTIFLTACVGCHAGMDAMDGAYAPWEWLTVENPDGTPNVNAGQLLYQQNYDPDTLAISPAVGGVTAKHTINATNFEPGYRVTDNSWLNYWRQGPNSSLGWGWNVNYTNPNGEGSGAASMGDELASTQVFAQCQVEKVYKHVCLQDPVQAHEADLNTFVDEMNTNTATRYNMRNVFAKVAPLCMGD